jgi:hypothetical protein
VLYAAAHVVADPISDNAPGSPAQLDWDATLAFRRHLWAHGLGVADAMDTAQRGMGLDWATTRELILRSGAEARAVGGALVCGAATDQLGDGPVGLDAIAQAYLEQCAVIVEAGGTPVLMASRQLAATARSADDYLDVYDRVLSQLPGKAVLHWLGEMFDPALHGYWGSSNLDVAADTVLQIITHHVHRIDGIKVSLLEADREVRLRQLLPDGVRCYTGDDFNYPELIRGESGRFSHALLGIFDAIAPVAAAAVSALDSGDLATYDTLMESTVALSRHIFGTPTYFYKTGLVFLAWLTGHQDHFVMVNGLQSARSITHLARLFVLADEGGLFDDPDLAVCRINDTLRMFGLTG